MKETLNLILTKFTDETLTISIGLMGICLVAIVAYWWHWRRKFNELKHQIPAQVVKNYLDSIIQNSSALKSSLFRGGGLDVEDGTPSVVPAASLGSTPVQVSGTSQEELNQKNAEIASLQASLTHKDKTISELEGKLSSGASAVATPDNSAEVDELREKVTDLEVQLITAQAAADSAGAAPAGEDLSGELAEVTKERDQLKEKLQEYEIIEEDLANLKRLQQENDQLRKSLEAGGVAAVAATSTSSVEADPLPVEEPDSLPVEGPVSSEPDPLPVEDIADNAEAEASVAEDIADNAEAAASVAEETADNAEAAAGAAEKSAEMGVPENEGEQKSAEELLSEFEKMLG